MCCGLPMGKDIAQRGKIRHNEGVAEPETIGQLVKRERLRRSMTQRELADLVGVGVPHISKIEANRENPSDGLLARVAQVFDRDVDELLLVARRLPEELLDQLAADPQASLQFLRTMNKSDD